MAKYSNDHLKRMAKIVVSRGSDVHHLLLVAKLKLKISFKTGLSLNEIDNRIERMAQ